MEVRLGYSIFALLNLREIYKARLSPKSPAILARFRLENSVS